MDFVKREFIFMTYFWLSSGTLSVLVEPYPENKAVLVETPNVAIKCYSSTSGLSINVQYQPVGDNRVMSVKGSGGDSNLKTNFTGAANNTDKSYTLTMKKARVFLAGTYSCIETTKMYSQVIVLSENPTCKFSPNQTEQLMCNETIQLSCTVIYAANEQYVVANMKWSTDASPSKGLKGSMDISRSENITTATSTLKVTWPVDGPGAMPVYSCNTSFSLVDGLSTEFSKKPPDYFNLCKPFISSDDVPCIQVERKKNYATTVTPDSSTDLAEKRKEHDDNTDGSFFVSSDTNIVLLTLCVAGSLLLAQEFEEDLH